NADDAPLGTPIAAMTVDAHEDAVAVHRLVDVRARDVHITREPLDVALGPDEGVSLGMDGDAPGHHVHELGHAIGLAAGLDEIPARDERPEHAANGRGFALLQLQRAHDLAHCRWVAEALADAGEKVVGARHAAYRLHPTTF